MVVCPVLTALAFPDALIVATLVAVELQVTLEVRFWVVPSVKIPVAVSCWNVPPAIAG